MKKMIDHAEGNHRDQLLLEALLDSVFREELKGKASYDF